MTDPASIQFRANPTTPLVTIRPDGSVEFGPDYTPEAAARQFWEYVGAHQPALAACLEALARATLLQLALAALKADGAARSQIRRGGLVRHDVQLSSDEIAIIRAALEPDTSVTVAGILSTLFGVLNDLRLMALALPTPLRSSVQQVLRQVMTLPPAISQAYLGSPWPASVPRIVCLCGSTRFWRTFQQAGLQETLAGKIVLSIGAASGTDDDHFAGLPPEEYAAVTARLDELHLRKVEVADEVLILNPNDYVGQSTRQELEYARVLGKRVRWLKESAHAKAGETVG